MTYIAFQILYCEPRRRVFWWLLQRGTNHIVSFYNVSFHNVSFHNVSFHDVSLHNVSFHNVSFHNVSLHNLSFHNMARELPNHEPFKINFTY
jgi:uncharacterized protein YjbI with pentapeptide repeats